MKVKLVGGLRDGTIIEKDFFIRIGKFIEKCTEEEKSGPLKDMEHFSKYPNNGIVSLVNHYRISGMEGDTLIATTSGCHECVTIFDC